MAKNYVKPIFSRRHYEVIAEWLKEKRNEYDNITNKTIYNAIMYDLTDLFEFDNPKFNRDKFIKKCREQK